MPPRARRASGGASSRVHGGVEKHTYMTRDAYRRLKLAKQAAKAVLRNGGTAEAAAAAAQAYGVSQSPAPQAKSPD